MRALRYAAVDGPLELVEVPSPACPDDGVVLSVAATGVCRSDWHAWRGHDPVSMPDIAGHEFAGAVAAVGPLVRNWQRGDRVMACRGNDQGGRCKRCDRPLERQLTSLESTGSLPSGRLHMASFTPRHDSQGNHW